MLGEILAYMVGRSHGRRSALRSARPPRRGPQSDVDLLIGRIVAVVVLLCILSMVIVSLA